MMVLHNVLQDTRQTDNPNQCALCGGSVQPIASDCTNAYGIYIFQCKQCGSVSSLLTEKLTENDTRKTAKA